MGLINELGKYVDRLDIDTGDEGEGRGEGALENPDIMKQGLSYDKGFTAEDADPEELSMGEKVEREHTDDPKLARKIALDHLAEIPDYYTRLKKMEAEAGRDLEEFISKY
jgi:hypothetical protein